MIKNLTGIILAGGKSSRMGADKSFVLFKGKPLVETVIGKLSPLFDDMMIVTNSPGPYKKYGISIYTDKVKDCGPLGGIYTGLHASSNVHNFIVACDMPFLNTGLVRFMAQSINGYDVVVPRMAGRLEPLCAVYSRSCIEPAEKAISEGQLKIMDFLKCLKVRILKEAEIARFDQKGRSFVNINTQKDREKAERERI